MIATITLNPSIDQQVTVKGLVKDDANRALSVISFPGGKGANVSRVVCELGGPTRAYALSAGLIGQFWAQELSKVGVPMDCYPVQGQTRINTVLTDTEDGTQTRISALGPMVSVKDQDLFLKKLLNVRPKPFCWVLGGSPSQGMKPAVYKHYIQALQKTGVPCILDADDEALRLGIQARPWIIKPNEFEMQRLVGKKISSLQSYLSAAQKLVKGGIGIVVVSLAARGALFVSKQEAFHVEGIPVPVRTRVGAGDSLLAGLAYGLYQKKSLQKAAALGIAASTSAVMRAAPRLCRRQDIPSFLVKLAARSFER